MAEDIFDEALRIGNAGAPSDADLDMIAPAITAFEEACKANGVGFAYTSEDWGFERAWIAAVRAVLAKEGS